MSKDVSNCSLDQCGLSGGGKWLKPCVNDPSTSRLATEDQGKNGSPAAAPSASITFLVGDQTVAHPLVSPANQQ